MQEHNPDHANRSFSFFFEASSSIFGLNKFYTGCESSPIGHGIKTVRILGLQKPTHGSDFLRPYEKPRWKLGDQDPCATSYL